MATSCHVTGLSFAKGQRLEDLLPLNPELTSTKLQETLTKMVEEKKLQSYEQGGSVFYMLPP
jgi:hypothetical protein